MKLKYKCLIIIMLVLAIMAVTVAAVSAGRAGSDQDMGYIKVNIPGLEPAACAGIDRYCFTMCFRYEAPDGRLALSCIPFVDKP